MQRAAFYYSMLWIHFAKQNKNADEGEKWEDILMVAKEIRMNAGVAVLWSELESALMLLFGWTSHGTEPFSQHQ